MGKVDAGRGGGDGSKKKSKAKMYYLKQARTSGQRSGGSSFGRQPSKLAVGMRGFLCTTNYNEKHAVKEAYNLLNEYYNVKDERDESDANLYPAQGASRDDQHGLEGGAPGAPKSVEQGSTSTFVELNKSDGTGQDTSGARLTADEDDDVESALKAEINFLKSPEVKYKFQSVDTGVRNLIFINSTVRNPIALAHKIFADVTEKKVQKSRFMLRMIPVETVCRAEPSDIKKAAEDIFPKYFKTGFNSFQVMYKSRYNDSVDRSEVIKSLANVVMEMNAFNTVNLTDPRYSIIVEIFRNMCCLSVVTDYNKFRKYNLIEASANTKVQQSSPAHGSVESTNQQSGEETSAVQEVPTQDVKAES